MGTFAFHQKALFQKQLYMKRSKWKLSIAEILTPALLIAVVGLALIYFVRVDNVPEYDFTDPKWDRCPIGFYGTYLDKLLPEDFHTSQISYSSAGISQFAYPPFLADEPELVNFPDGIIDKICTPDVISQGGKQLRTSSDSANLKELINYIDTGTKPRNARFTYSIVGDESADIHDGPSGIHPTSSQKPNFILWLEQLTTAFRPPLTGVPGYTCPTGGCPSNDDLIFDMMFKYDCSTVDMEAADCTEWNDLSREQLDGPGVIGDVANHEVVYRHPSSIEVPNEYDAELVHLRIEEVPKKKLDITVRPNNSTKMGAQSTLPLMTNPVKQYGRNQLYEPSSIQGFYGSSHRGWLMDVEPLIALYAARDGSGSESSALSVSLPTVKDHWTVLITSMWWSSVSFERVKADKKSTLRTGVPLLPWYFEAALPTEKDGDGYSSDSALIDRIEYAKLAKSLFAPACHLKNAAVNLPASEAADKARMDAFYNTYVNILTQSLKFSSSNFNDASGSTNPILTTHIDTFVKLLTDTIDKSVDIAASPVGTLPCSGQELEQISKALSMLFHDHYQPATFGNKECDCTNNFCGLVSCDFWFQSIYSMQYYFFDTIVTGEVFESTLNMGLYSTKEAAFPQPAGAISLLGWQFNSQTLPYQAVMFSFMCPGIFFIRLLMNDKENGVIPYLNVIGITQFEYWWSYYLIGFLYNLCFSLFCSIMMMFVLSYPNFLLLFLGFLSQGILILALCVFLTAVTRTGNSAVLILIITMVTCNSLFMWLRIALVDRHVWLKYISCLAPGFIIDFVFRNLMVAEIFTVCPDGGDCTVKGGDISYWWREIDGVACGWILLMGFACAIFWASLGHYLYNVAPTDETPPKKWNFICSPSYWRAKRGLHAEQEEEDDTPPPMLESNPERFEPFTGTPILEIKNVSKRFKNAKKRRDEDGKYFYAVNGMNLEVKKGEIYGLLGHNGAGKTTLMNMMIGKMNPTSGHITINGWDVASAPSQAKAEIGFCPQFDILFPYMTVRQHFAFVAKVKQCADPEAEIAYASKVLDLDSKLDFYVDQLSGGQRRRCSVGMAVIGRPALVILDEPSTGIDPATRRSLWTCIKRIGKDCAIIITTHFMDEADYLSDRIGIMCAGQLMASGRPHFLKNACGSGYAIIMSKAANVTLTMNEELKRTVLDMIPSSTMRSDIANEIVFNVPFTAIHELTKLVERLEQDANAMGVVNFCVNVASIEDVFLKVGSHKESKVDEIQALESDVFSDYAKYKVPDGFKSLLTNNLKPLFMKRFWMAMRKKLLLVVSTLGPLLNFLLFGAMILTQFSDEGAVTMSISGDVYRNLNGYNMTSPIVYVVGDDALAKCLDELDGNGYTVKTVKDSNELKTALKDAQIDGFLSSDSEPPLFAIDIKGVDSTTGMKDVTLLHNSAFFTWSLPIGYLDMTRCYIKTRVPDYELKVQYKPQKRINDDGGSILDAISKSALNMIIVFSLIYTSCTWVVQLIVERSSKSKYLQMVAGANPYAYWISNWCTDLLIAIPGVVLLCIAAWGFEAPVFRTADSTGAFIVAIFLYLISDIPRSYCFARLFNGTVQGIGLNFTYGGVLTVVGSILPVLTSEPGVNETIYAFNMLPTFLLQMHATQISNIVTSCPFNESTQPELHELYCDSVWDMSYGVFSGNQRGFGYYLTRHICNFIFWCLVLGAIDYCDLHPQKFAMSLKSQRDIVTPEDAPAEDLSVIAERKRILDKYGDVERDSAGRPLNDDYPTEVFDKYNKMKALRPEGDIEGAVRDDEADVDLLVLRGLRKAFVGKKGCCCGAFGKCCGAKRCGGSPNKVAVDDLSFSVNRGECFGFLGMNGAGKTTTVSMLIGELARTSGAAHFDGVSVSSGRTEFYKNIGFCPQFDGLIPSLTGREILRFYALLSGMRSDKVDEFSDKVIALIGVRDYADRLISTYSGGNKRKLSLALAFVGNPKVVFLDEPSSGVDPASQRRLWSVITETTRNSDRCVILTTHAMDECEALCDRLCIMKEGRMMCIGGANDLKANYGKGYMVETYVDGNVTESINQLKKKFTRLEVQEIISNRLRFMVPKEDAKLSELLAFLAEEANQYGLRDFGVSDISLEAIFVQLNLDQMEEIGTDEALIEPEDQSVHEYDYSYYSDN